MTDPRHMHLALRLARRGRGWVEPNPMVGCVLVRDRQVIGQGYHRRYGGPHAEINALSDCRRRGHDPGGATVYVTLEPCSHHGKTGPCTEALIAAKPAVCCVAAIDPARHAAGHGIAALRARGIAVQVGCCQAEAHQLNEAYLKRTTCGLPWVMAKWAQTVDGAIATRGGHSQWISGSRSRRHAHQLRARVDAILVGIGTVLADDPQLTARQVSIRRVARRVVLDPQLRLPVGSRLLAASAAPVTVATGPEADCRKRDALVTRGVELVTLQPVPGCRHRLAVTGLLQHLADRHAATHVLAEGGSRLLGSLFGQGLVDQLLVYLAPRLMGDARAVGAVAGLAPLKVDHAQKLALAAFKRLGEDLLLDYRLVTTGPDAPATAAPDVGHQTQ